MFKAAYLAFIAAILFAPLHLLVGGSATRLLLLILASLGVLFATAGLLRPP